MKLNILYTVSYSMESPYKTKADKRVSVDGGPIQIKIVAFSNLVWT